MRNGSTPIRSTGSRSVGGCWDSACSADEGHLGQCRPATRRHLARPDGEHRNFQAGGGPARRGADIESRRDGQADLSVHGGPFKAVSCYPSEHCGPWKAELGGRELPIAIFGENLTTEGLDEASVHLGDCFSIGSAQVIVTQPRMPCYKLGIRLQSATIVKTWRSSGAPCAWPRFPRAGGNTSASG